LPTKRHRRGHLAALGRAVFKKEADLKPHRVRYWPTPKPDPDFDAKCADICEVYKAAAGADDTHRTISIDEMTGIQALERIAPGLPMLPGKIERREFQYRRHGTQTFTTIAAADFLTAATTIADFVQSTFNTLATVLSVISAGTITTFAEIHSASWPANS
jgi:hypothetical protein